MSIHVRVAAGQPIAVEVDGRPVALRPKERVVTAGFALHHPESTSVSQLISLVWPGGEPATAKQSIHNHLARLRSAIPGLVSTTPTGYSFGDDVTVDVDGHMADGEFLIELADVTDLRRARIGFRRRHASNEQPDPAHLLRSSRADELIAAFEATVDDDGCDERAWWLLAIASVKRDGAGAGTATIARARAAMRDVGLNVGRRLVDLDGMLRDGIDNVDVLLRDGYGTAHESTLDHLGTRITECASAVRSAWSEYEHFVVGLNGPDDAHRRAMLARVVDDARASGFSTACVRLRADDLGNPSVMTTLLGGRPLVAVVDLSDPRADLSSSVQRISMRLSEPPVGWVVAGDVDVAALSTAVGHGPTDGRVLIELREAEPSSLDVGAVSPIAARLVAVLAALGEPVPIDDLEAAVPAVRVAALDATRAGMARVDAASKAIDLASSHVAQAALARLDDSERAEIARDLRRLDLPGLDDARRSDLRSRWSIQAFGASDERTIAQTLEAADAYSRRGEYGVAAAIIERTLDPIAAADGRSADWCRLAIDAGRALMAAGDASGDALLGEVAAAAWEIGNGSLAAGATLEWCRLGAAGGAGSADEPRLRVISELLDHLVDPGDRARVGAAAAMVLSLSGDPDLLRARFVDSVRDAAADADADPTVMAEVLPLAYMSIPLHSDLDARESHAASLIRLADGLDRSDVRWEGLQIRYSCEVMRGDPDFRSTLAELHDVAWQLHERSREWEMHFIRSNVAIIDGDLDRARREVDESLDFAGQVNSDRVAAVFGAHHLVASMLDGTVGDLLDPLRVLARDQPRIGAWHAAHAVAAAAAGAHDEAVDALALVTRGGRVDLVRDPVYSAGLVAIGEAAAATGDRTALAVADEALSDLAGMWSWCGSCTFGPIDLTRARVARALGDSARAEELAAAAVITSSEMRAPMFTRQATDLLLTLATPLG